MKTPQPLTLTHTFVTGHRLTIRMEDGKVAGRFIWDLGQPSPHVFQTEYPKFIRAVMSSAANHFKQSILWFIPGDIGEFVIFNPENSTTNQND